MRKTFDLKHWLSVRAERARQGLTAPSPVPSPLPFERVLELATQRTFQVSGVECPVDADAYLTAILTASDGTVLACVVDTTEVSPLSAKLLHATFVEEFSRLPVASASA